MGGATVVSSGPMGMPGAAVGTEVGSSVVAGSAAAPPSAITPVAIVNKFGADKAFAVVFLLLYNQNKSRPETVLNIAHTYLNKIGPTPADKGHYMQGVLGKLQGHRDHLPKVFETCEKFSSETVPVRGARPLVAPPCVAGYAPSPIPFPWLGPGHTSWVLSMDPCTTKSVPIPWCTHTRTTPTRAR